MTKLILSKLVFENEIVLGIEFPDANTLPVSLFTSCHEVTAPLVEEVSITRTVFTVVFKRLMLILPVVPLGDQ